MEWRATKSEGIANASTDSFRRDLRSICKDIDLSACSSNGFTPVPEDVGNSDSAGSNIRGASSARGNNASEDDVNHGNTARVLRTVDNIRTTQQLTPARFLPESSCSSYGCDYTKNAGSTPSRVHAAEFSDWQTSALGAARPLPGMQPDVYNCKVSRLVEQPPHVQEQENWVEKLYPEECAKIADPDDDNWQHGFNSGVLATCRLVMGIVHAIQWMEEAEEEKNVFECKFTRKCTLIL